MNPLISVIIPVYKVEGYLDECLLSVCGQTYKNLEIILVDDGSPDKCPQMCDAWADKDNRIKVIHKENGGLSDARNAGMDIARGEYITFVDSDDYIAQTMYEKLLKGFSCAENIAIVSCLINTYEEGKIEPFRKEWDVAVPTILRSKDFVNSKMLELTSHCTWNKLYRHSLIRNIRFWKGRNNEDTLFMYELSKQMENEKWDELILPDRCYFYRKMRAGSICSSTSRPLMVDIIDNLKFITNDLKTRRPKLYNEIYPQYVDKLFVFFNSLYGNPVWTEKYFAHFLEQVKEVPICYLWRRYTGEKRKRYLACRLIPCLRMKWLRKKGLI